MEGFREESDQLIVIAAKELTAHKRRLYIAEVTLRLCGGNSRQSEERFGWGRATAEKGLRERASGIRCEWRRETLKDASKRSLGPDYSGRSAAGAAAAWRMNVCRPWWMVSVRRRARPRTLHAKRTGAIRARIPTEPAASGLATAAHNGSAPPSVSSRTSRLSFVNSRRPARTTDLTRPALGFRGEAPPSPARTDRKTAAKNLAERGGRRCRSRSANDRPAACRRCRTANRAPGNGPRS